MRQTYPFEIYANNSPPSQATCDEYLETLKANLGIGKAGTGAEGVLERLIQVLHVNAQWFKDRAEEEEGCVKVYVVLSVAIGVLIPVVVVTLSAFASTGSVIVAQVSAIITGVMGLHRTLGKWLGQRAAAGTYWSARSRLVDEIYALEADWGTRAETDKIDRANDMEFTDKFHEAILAVIEKGRGIVRAHMDAYYAGLKPDTTDDIKGRLTGLTADNKEIRQALDELGSG